LADDDRLRRNVRLNCRGMKISPSSVTCGRWGNAVIV
jgi:hypothetical protein